MEDSAEIQYEAKERLPEFVNMVSHDAKLKQLLRNLTSIESKLCSEASKEFRKLLKSDVGFELLRTYIQTSPKFVEFLQVWDLRKGKNGFSHFLKLITAIFSHPLGTIKSNSNGNVPKEFLFVCSSLDKFARVIVGEKMGDLYKELNSKEAKRQNAVLLLLASIVRRGQGLAWEVAKSFDFKMEAFPKLAEWKVRRNEGRRKNLTRRAFVGFAMSFLEVGNPRLLRGILQQRNMYSGVLRGLGNDDDETVIYVLSTLRDRVLIPDSLVPPGLRSVLFGSVTLEQLITISGRGDDGDAAELAHNLLNAVCTDPSNGLMPDLGRMSNPLKGNRKRLLDLLKKLKATEVYYHRDLLLAVVKGRPAFGSAYLDEFPYNLEDLASPNWFAAVTLAANVMSSVGDAVAFGFSDSQFQEPPSFDSSDVQDVVKCIGPRPFTRLVINKGLLHSDPLVKHGTLRLLLEELKLLDSLIGTLNDKCTSKGQMTNKWASLKQDIQNGVRILLPDPQVLLSLVSSFNKSYKNPKSNLKRPADRELLEHNFKDKKLKASIMNDDIDILVSGVSSSPLRALGEEGEGVIGKCEVNKSINNADIVNPVPEIWGLNQCSSGDVAVENAETYFYSKLLDVLQIYQRTLPMAFEGSFDFFRVLPSNPLALPAILQRSILSLLVEQVAGSHKDDIAMKTQPQMYKYLQPFINMFMYSPIRDIRNQAYALAQAAMLSTGAFDRNPTEICTWFLFIPGCSKDDIYAPDMEIAIFKKLSSAVISFLCDAVSTTGNNLFKYLDIVRCYICDAQGAKDKSTNFSPFIICVLEKCLRLLGSESGTSTLPEKSLISLYVSTTLKYVLETQVEPGPMSFLVGLLLSEKLEGCCNVIGVSSVPCEWRPLKSLLHFTRNIMHHEIRGSFTAVGDAICSGGSLSNTLTEVERILGSEYHDALQGITIGFSFSMVCTPLEELVHYFPEVISISSQLLGVPFSLLSIIFFLEPRHLSYLFKLWPEVCSAGMKKVKTKGHHGEGKEEIVCYENIDSLESAPVAFSLFLERAPFHVLFPAILFIDDSCSLGQPEIQNLLLDKLSKWTPEYSINSFCHVLSCIYHARSSYRIKPSRELEKLCDFSFLLAGQILKQCLVEQVGYDNSVYDWVPFSARVNQVVEIILHHPLVTETLECPLSSDESFTDETFLKSPESFLEFAAQVVNKMDQQVIDLLTTTSELLAPLYCSYGYLSGVHSPNKQIAMAFKALADKLSLIFKYKFTDGIKARDLTSLVPTSFALHRLIGFVSPFELLELVHWLFSRTELNDTALSPSFKGCALAVGLHTAAGAFDSFLEYMMQLNLKGTQFHLFSEKGKESIDVTIFEKILFQVFEIATSFELDLSDLCLLKAVKVVRLHRNVEKSSLPSIMSLSRLVSSIPIKILSHCMHMVTKTKAEMLFLLCEISPLHLSAFAQLFSDMMDNCSHPHSDQVLMLLPSVLLYLNAAFLKFGGQLFQHFANIISFFWRILTHGFSNWKSYVLEDMFDMRSVECMPLSMEQFLNLVSHSLLGKAIFLMQHYLHLSGHLVKLRDRLCLFSSVCPHSSKYDDLLDFNIREVSVCSFEQPLNLANVTVAKIRFCRMLLFPDHSQFQSLLEEDGNENKIHTEVSSSRVRFLNMLVKSWQLIVKKSNSDIGSSGQREKANILLFSFLEIFIANNILELVVAMRDYLIKLNSLPFIEQLAKSFLLYRFEDPATLKILRTVLATLSEGKFSCISILQLLLSHSQFASTLLSGCRPHGPTQFGMAFTPTSSIMKSVVFPRTDKDVVSRESNMCMSDMKQLELVKLLRVLFQIKAQKSNSDAEACSAIKLKELVLLLLSSYSAMVTEIDLEIYLLMSELESSDESVAETIIEMDYLWGSAALGARKEREEEQNVSMNNQNDAEAVEEHRRIQFREHFPIDPKLCEKTLLFFPFDRSAGKRNLNKPKTDDFHEVDAANDEKMQVYDPFFILHFASHCLSMGYIEPLEFTSFGLLALAFVSLSSPDEAMRKLGYEVLGIFKSSLEKCEKRKDVLRLRLLLTYMQNGITEPFQRISSVTAIFVAEASFVLLDSSHDHYSAISKTLMRSPSVNMKGIPLFQEFFCSSSVTFKTERLWILQLLNTALNADDDAQIYIRNSVFENVMNFYTSPLAGGEARQLIIQMVRKSVKLHKLARYLVEQCGLISWLSSLVSSFSGSLYKDNGGSQLARLAELLEVVNEVVAFRNTSEWLQKFALEQLAELSSHLYRLLLVCVEFTHKDARIIDSILQIVMATLKISQKRKVYQPHVTLSFECLIQLCEAINACSSGRFTRTAELGLKAILMSTPAVTIWEMDQDKLLKFLSWAISTAVQSNKINMPQPEAAYYRSVMFSEESSEENLTAKLLRWLTASVIHGRLSWKSSDVDYSCRFDRLKLHTLQSLMNYCVKRSGDNQGVLGLVEILAASIFYLQQLIGIQYRLLPSVVSALCLLLFTAPFVADSDSALGDCFPLTTFFLKVRSPPEANPAWRWSYYQPWKDLSFECAVVEKLEEIQACQMLLVAISKKLGGKSLFSVSLQDLENCGVFEWERSILESA